MSWRPPFLQKFLSFGHAVRERARKPVPPPKPKKKRGRYIPPSLLRSMANRARRDIRGRKGHTRTQERERRRLQIEKGMLREENGLVRRADM